MRNIIAADLGDANIPTVFAQSASPKTLQTLYWREQSTNPADTTIEIWKTDDDSFVILTGYFGDKEWGYDDVSLFNEYPTIQNALADARSYFALVQDEEPEAVAASVNFKRLIRKA